jgi:CBS domain containing-hemolysin-like protein
MGILDKLFERKKKLNAGQGQGAALDAIAIEEKRDMIRGVEDLSETSVKEVMIPRIDVDFISVKTTQDELIEKIAASGHSRFPVYSESIDNVIGVLYVKDLIAVFAHKETIDLEKSVRKAFFVPESKRIDSLLREFKRRHIHIAIAIDEYGGVSGIVCMEDIIEEIVGDIQDEFDNEREDIVAVGDNVWLCDSRVNLEDLNETVSAHFPDEEFETLGGFVFDLFGKIPAKYEKVSWEDFDFIVQDMEGHKVNTVKVIRRIEDTEKQ